MARLLTISKIAACLAAALFLVVLSVVAWRLDERLARTERRVDTLLTLTSASVVGFASDAHGTIGAAHVVLDTTNGAIAGISRDTHRTLAAASSTIVGLGADAHNTTHLLDKDIVDAKSLLVHADMTLDSERKASASQIASVAGIAADVHTAIADPNIGKTVANVQATTKALSVIAVDGAETVDKYAHPSKKRLGFWASVYAGAQVAHKFLPPIF